MRSLVSLMLLPAACAFGGPGTVTRDRFDYVAAISRSQDEQMLLNLVRARYAETPLFLDIDQVVSSYEFEGQVGASVGDIGRSSSAVELGANQRFTERPTITYQPVTGRRFDEVLVTPIPPGAALFLIQAGFDPRLVLRMTMDAINGHRNCSHIAARDTPCDPAFDSCVTMLASQYRIGAVGFRLERDAARGFVTTLLLRRLPGGDAAQVADGVALRAALGLAPDADRLQVAYGPPDDDPLTVDMLTRPLLQVLNELSAGVQLPDARTDRRALLPRGDVDGEALIRVHCGGRPGGAALVAVTYRGAWFWIDDDDRESKQAFAFLVLLFHVMAAGPNRLAPVLTIPT